jgi:enoyl-CoA hydratase/carnithine racemase
MYEELEQVARALEKKLPRAVVVTGAGRDSFSAGFDVNPDNPMVGGLIKAVETGDRPPIEKVIQTIRRTVDRFVQLPVPLIAAINGDAYGGGAEFAVRCDMRVMAADAVICFAEVKLGLMPDWGGTATLARLVGSAKAADMILSARRVNAEEALAMGLVNHICDAGKALETAMDIAGKIAANGPQAVRHALEVIRSAHNMPLSESLELESKNAVALIATGECVHGISAFLSKQPAEFPDPED